MSQEYKIILALLLLQFVAMGNYVAENDKEIREQIIEIKKEIK